MKIAKDDQIELLSKTFQEQLATLSDIDFCGSPFGDVELSKLQGRIFAVKAGENKDNNIKELLVNFRSAEGKDF